MFFLPGQVPAVFVYVHFAGLEVVEFFPDGSFVFGGQPGPRLVRPTLVVRTWRHLDVVVEFDDLEKKSNAYTVQISIKK